MKRRATRNSRLKEDRSKSFQIWKSFVAEEHAQALGLVLHKLGRKEIVMLNDILTSVFQYQDRMRKQREEFEAEKKRRIAILEAQDAPLVEALRQSMKKGRKKLNEEKG